jgi:mono/diheme cytochrome c family protein
MWKRGLLLAVLVAVCVGLWFVLTTPGLKPVIISVYEPPILHVDQPTHNLGVVPTDSKVQHTFYLYNMGGKPLRIHKVDTSCGCTATQLPKQVLAPGDHVPLNVTLDTSIKLGDVKKTIQVYSNDPQHPVTNLYLVGNVILQMKGHGPIAVKDPLVLFKGECATCHVNQGLGKTGKALFAADCAMCHGMRGQGGVGPSLMTGDYEQAPFRDYIRKIIAEGSPRSPEMPPYHQSKGGPLNDAEIDSLVNYLRFQSRELASNLDKTVSR